MTEFACFVETHFGFRLTLQDFKDERQLWNWLQEFKLQKIEFQRAKKPTARQLFPSVSKEPSDKFVVIDLEGLYFCRTTECIEGLSSDRQPEFRLRTPDRPVTWGYTRPYFDDFLRSVCSLLKDHRVVVCLDIAREDLVNMLYVMTYGKRRLKFLETSVFAISSSSNYRDSENGIRVLDRASLNILGPAVYLQDL